MNPFDFLSGLGATLDAWLEELESKDPSFSFRAELEQLESEAKKLLSKQGELKSRLVRDYQALDELSDKVAKFQLRAELARRHDRVELADKADALIAQLRTEGARLFEVYKENDRLYSESRRQLAETQAKVALIKERIRTTGPTARTGHSVPTGASAATGPTAANPGVGASRLDEFELERQFRVLETELELEALKNRHP
jgi:phage shock protein A